MSTPATSDDPAAERHLAMLDELAEIGMILARRLRDLPPLPGQDCARDFDLIGRVVRRAILLYHLLEQGRLPNPKTASGVKPEPNPAATRGTAGDARTRLDPIDNLDDVSGPFQQVVASIVHDIQAALATSHYPADQATLVQHIIHRRVPPLAETVPIRPEADTADLN